MDSQQIKIDTNGMHELEAGRAAKWDAPPSVRKQIDLRQNGESGALVVVPNPGTYEVCHAAGGDIQWVTLQKDGPAKPAPGVGVLAKVRGAMAWVWGKVKAAATSKASGYVLVAVLTAAAFVGTSQFQGCTIPWPNPINPSGVQFEGPLPDGSESMLALLKKSGPGVNVMVVYETSSKLTPDQDSAMHAAVVKDWIFSNCTKGPDGKTVNYREFDQDILKDLSKEAKLWQDLAARPRKSIPWVIISK